VREYNPENYSDLIQAYKKVQSLNRNINDKFILLGFDYINKIHGKMTNERFFDIRDSITLRLDSVLFHYKILDSIYSPGQKLVDRDFSPINYMTVSMHQKFLFDSIIFNSISVFDYLSCLITYIREKNKDNWRKTWTSLENFARGHKAFKQSSLGTKIIAVNRDWVNVLNDYRSELIHYNSDHLPSSESYNVIEGTVEILVLAPAQLKKYFKPLSELKGDTEFNINSISLWIIEMCLNIVLELMQEIKVFIEENRVISDANAIMIFKK